MLPSYEEFKHLIIESIPINFEKAQHELPPTCILLSSTNTYFYIPLIRPVFEEGMASKWFFDKIKKEHDPVYLAFVFEALTIKLAPLKNLNITQNFSELIDTSTNIIVNIFEVKKKNEFLRWQVMKLGAGIKPFLEFFKEEDANDSKFADITFYNKF